MYINWTIFNLTTIWDMFDLDSVLRWGNQIFKSTEKYRRLSVENLPQQFFIKIYTIQ